MLTDGLRIFAGQAKLEKLSLAAAFSVGALGFGIVTGLSGKSDFTSELRGGS